MVTYLYFPEGHFEFSDALVRLSSFLIIQMACNPRT